MKRLLVDANPHSTRIGMVENGELTEFIYENNENRSLVGNIYAGRVTSVHKGMQACFIDIGQDKNAYMAMEKGVNIQTYSQMIVQVEKDASGTKGAVVTDKISFAGKFLVLMAKEKGHIGISKKIAEEEERERIKKIVTEILPQGFGVIIRTEAVEKTKEDFFEEIARLHIIAKATLEKGEYVKAPSLMHLEEDMAIKAARDLFSSHVDEIVINREKEYNYIKGITSSRPERVIFYESKIPLFEHYFVEAQAEKILNKKVWLKSGGFLIIEELETCVVIDVNTGKFTGKRDFQETIFKTNLEAAYEIVKQLKLRNLVGMIIIDFIDMKDFSKRAMLKSVLEKEVRKDRIQTTVVGMTELGLMQLTRKKTSVPVSHKLTSQCKFCRGSGRVESYEYISDKITREIISIFAQTIFNHITLSSNKAVLKQVAGYKNANIEKLEEEFGKKIVLKEIETASHNHYEIERKTL